MLVVRLGAAHVNHSREYGNDVALIRASLYCKRQFIDGKKRPCGVAPNPPEERSVKRGRKQARLQLASEEPIN